MNKGDDVARLPNYSAEDECCSVCGDDNIVVVLNGEDSQINLCSWCFSVMKENLSELGI